MGLKTGLVIGAFLSAAVAYAGSVIIQGQSIVLNHDNWSQAVSLSTRTAPQTPVPSFRPTKPNMPIGFDLIPSGPAPVEFGDNGFSWFDACDSDILAVDLKPVTCARMGVRGDRIEIGSRAWFGAPNKPVYISQNGYGYLGVLPDGQIVFYGVAVAEDNAGAVAEGVPVGGMYRTSTGGLKVRY
jgi:hypothetical protein